MPHDRPDLAFILQLDPGLDQILGENPAFEQEVIVVPEGLKRFLE